MIAHEEYWDDVPPLGRKGWRWLRRLVYRATQDWLRDETKVDPGDPDAAPLIAALVSDLVAGPSSLVSWQDEEHFSGQKFCGHYVFKKAEVRRRLPELFTATAQRLDATYFAQLDDWLEALQDGVLFSSGPAEPSCSRLLDRVGVGICRKCRGRFAPDRINAVRCPQCRPGRKKEAAHA